MSLGFFFLSAFQKTVYENTFNTWARRKHCIFKRIREYGFQKKKNSLTPHRHCYTVIEPEDA